MKDLEENGWYKRPKLELEEKDINWNNPIDFVREIFKRYAKKKERSDKATDRFGDLSTEEFWDRWNEKTWKELELLDEYQKRQADTDLSKTEKDRMLVPW